MEQAVSKKVWDLIVCGYCVLVQVFIAGQSEPMRIHNKTDSALLFLIEGDFSAQIYLSPGQEKSVLIPPVDSLIKFTVEYRGSDPRYSGLRKTTPFSIVEYGAPEVVEILFLPFASNETEPTSSYPHRAYRFVMNARINPAHKRNRDQGRKEPLISHDAMRSISKSLWLASAAL